MSPEQQRHPQVQADVAQARRVVAAEEQQAKSATNSSQQIVGGAADRTTKEMIPWDNNPGSVERDVEEAAVIFEKGIAEFLATEKGKRYRGKIDPSLISNIVMRRSPEGGLGGGYAFADYGPFESRDPARKKQGVLSWDDVFEELGVKNVIPVRVDERVLVSDQAIVGIIAHELFELTSIREALSNSEHGYQPKERVKALIDRAHWDAVDLQNDIVAYFKSKSQNSHPY